jgi:hypothetical protein
MIYLLKCDFKQMQKTKDNTMIFALFLLALCTPHTTSDDQLIKKWIDFVKI